MPTPPSPLETYRERSASHRAEAARLGRRERALSWVRLALFLILVSLLVAVLFRRPGAWPALLVPLAAFAVALVAHDRTIRARQRAERAARFHECGIERIEDRWAGRGTAGASYLDPDHPYAADLDLFGRGSLFELLCAARTRPGERTLAAWLCAAAAPEEIRERQRAVADLRDRLDLRERLAVAGEEIGSAVDFDRLREWSTAPAALASGVVPWAAALLAAANLAGLFLAVEWRSEPLAVAFVASAAFVAALRVRVRSVLTAVEGPEHDLELLGGILGEIERESFDAPRLRALGQTLREGGALPSRRIAALARLVEVHESRRNVIFAPLAAALLAGPQLACAMDRWRRASGSAVASWLDAVGEIEALASLAALAAERPADPFPEIVEGEARLEGEALAHPLLPAARAVGNDVRLGARPRLLVVSGSNMSGKSTLLRTVGVNAVLALAGAPVRARRMTLSPLALGACMRVQDSLQEGHSHFYAEIRRLRRVLDLCAGPRPVLFLLDEILHGTNSHDRRAGAEILLRALADRGAIGLVTTHDLALAGIAEGLSPEAENVHFADHLEGDRIAFDYRLQPGVAGRGNALVLMRLVLGVGGG